MRPRHLTTQFALAIAGLVIVSLGGLSGLAITVTRRTVREHIEASNTTSAALAARAIEQYVTASVSIVEEAAQRPKLSQDLRAANWPEASRGLDNITQHFEQFDSVFVQDAQGVIKARVPYAETVGQDFSFQPFFQEAMPVESRRRRAHGEIARVVRAGGKPSPIPHFPQKFPGPFPLNSHAMGSPEIKLGDQTTSTSKVRQVDFQWPVSSVCPTYTFMHRPCSSTRAPRWTPLP